MSNVTRTNHMFENTPFNQPIGNWILSNVDRMHFMFRNATSFNQDISGWDVSNVTFSYGVAGMFENATAFDQNLSTWDISNITTMENMFLNAGLSQSNQEATLKAWAAQTLQSNVPFHLGLKVYSTVGDTAVQTLRNTYNWTVTEQYQAKYTSGQNASLIGTGTQSPLNSGATTTAVEIKPDSRCTFQSWSDGSKANPRTDVLTDNLTVSALISCASSGGTSARARADNLEAQGKTDEAKAIRDRFNITTSVQSTDATATIEDTIATIQTFIERNDQEPVDRNTVIKLLTLLLALLEALTSLLLEVEGSSNI